MKTLKKIAVIGAYGSGTDYATGQAVKCHALVDWMKKQYGEDEIEVINTYVFKKNPLKLAQNAVSLLKTCRNIVIMPIQHELRVLAPVIFFFNKFFHRSIHYIVIGGWLPGKLSRIPLLKKFIAPFDGIYVELVSMKEKLNAMGMNNAYFMPNSRELPALKSHSKPERGKPLYICTYSRVVKTKGIEDAVSICQRANQILGSDVFRLDIYGRIEETYKEEFEGLMKNHRDIATYQGCKDMGDTVATLEKHYAVLFPTYYVGEGFAGTILDAFAAELPIIANDWKYNAEIIEDGENGFIYPFRDIEKAAEKLVMLYQNPGLYEKISEGCKKSAEQYSTKNVMREFMCLLK